MAARHVGYDAAPAMIWHAIAARSRTRSIYSRVRSLRARDQPNHYAAVDGDCNDYDDLTYPGG